MVFSDSAQVQVHLLKVHMHQYYTLVYQGAQKYMHLPTVHWHSSSQSAQSNLKLLKKKLPKDHSHTLPVSIMKFEYVTGCASVITL